MPNGALRNVVEQRAVRHLRATTGESLRGVGMTDDSARTLATCDGPPDYTYKVAYEEAGALLARLGELV